MRWIEHFALGVVGGALGAITIAVLTTTGDVATAARDSFLYYLVTLPLILPSGFAGLILGRATDNSNIAFFTGAVIPLAYGVYLLI